MHANQIDVALVEGIRMDICTRARLADKLFAGNATPEDYKAIDQALSRLKRQHKITWSPTKRRWFVMNTPPA